MRVVRYLIQVIGVFLAGTVSFFVLLFAITCLLCLLCVGFACALFTLWAGVHFFFYLTLHDRAAGHHALQSIEVAAGCFGVIVLAASTVIDLLRWARRPKLTMAVAEEDYLK